MATPLDRTFFHQTLAEADPDVARAVADEGERQESGLELIASENFVSAACSRRPARCSRTSTPRATRASATTAAASSSTSSNRWPSRAPRRCSAPSTPTCSRTRAPRPTWRCYLALLKPGDTILGMNLAHGGHLTHGHPLNFSGKLFTIVPYGVRQDDERIDYDEVERLAARAQAEADRRRRQRLPAHHRLRAHRRDRRATSARC